MTIYPITELGLRPRRRHFLGDEIAALSREGGEIDDPGLELVVGKDLLGVAPGCVPEMKTSW